MLERLRWSLVAGREGGLRRSHGGNGVAASETGGRAGGEVFGVGEPLLVHSVRRTKTAKDYSPCLMDKPDKE